MQNTTVNMPEPWFVTLTQTQKTGLETVAEAMARTKDMNLLQRDLKGINGVIEALGTNKEKGISGDYADVGARKKIFGTNAQLYPERNLVNDLYICAQEAVQDLLVVILILFTLVSLFFAIKDSGIRSLWPGRGTQLLEIVAVVTVTALVNFWPSVFSCSRQIASSCFYPQTDVVRHNGLRMKISSDDIVVGDMVFLNPGDRVPADGLFIDGHSLQLVNIENPKERHQLKKICPKKDPAMLSGYMVASGHSQMVVTAVKEQRRSNPMPRQVKWMKGLRADELRMLAAALAWLGRVLGLFTLMSLLFRFSFEEIDADHVIGRDKQKAEIVQLLIALVAMLATSAIVALTSGIDALVFAVKLTLAYSMRVLLKENQILIKKPGICHQAASVDWICFNKTGTLTSDDLQVGEFRIGLEPVEFVPSCPSIDKSMLELHHQAFGLNNDEPNSKSSTEKAIYEWATRHLGMVGKDELLKSYNMNVAIDPFAPLGKKSGIWITKKSDGKIHLHQKGAADVILQMCSGYYDCQGRVYSISDEVRESLNSAVKIMENKGLRCIAFAHRETTCDELSEFYCEELTLLALVGFENPVRDGFIEFVQNFRAAELNLSLLTGDSASTATSLAKSCGLLNEDDNLAPGLVVEGKDFRGFTPEERTKKVDKIRILAKATPEDKLLMIQTLKMKGRVVAYLGGALGDAQGLKEANLGVCFGTKNKPEILKACSDIVMKNKDVSQVWDILKWGRGFYNSIETYVQCLLIATCVNLMLDFVTILFPGGFTDLFAVSVISSGELPTPVFQLLWVKLIFSTIAPLSVLIKNPSNDLMSRPPRGLNELLLTDEMERNMGAQALCQILHLLAIHFMGESMLKLNPEEKSTALFNTYMLSQVFSLIHAKMYDRRNASQDIQNKKWFWGVVAVITTLQVIMVELWKSISGTARLNSRQWGLCIFMAASSIPASWILGNIYTFKLPSHYKKWKID